MQPSVCDVKEPWSGWLTGPCAMAIQDAEWRRNKERRRSQECASCLPGSSPSWLPCFLYDGSLCPNDDRGEKEEGRGGRGEAAAAAALLVGGAKRMSRAPSSPSRLEQRLRPRVISSQVRVTFVRHYSEQGIEQARSEVGEGTLPVFLCELQIEECFGTEILHGSRHINFHFSDCRAD